MLDYEITLRREVLREKSAGILADLDNFLDIKGIDETDRKHTINILIKMVVDIYGNIFKQEYDSFEKLNEANGKLDFAKQILEELN